MKQKVLISRALFPEVVARFEGEPDFLPGLLELPNLVMTPHNAPGSEATRRAMANLAADNPIAALGQGPNAGRPPNPINPDVLYARGRQDTSSELMPSRSA